MAKTRLNPRKSVRKLTEDVRAAKPKVRRAITRGTTDPAPPPPEELLDTWTRLEPQLPDAKLRTALLWSMHGATADEASQRAGVTPGSLNYWLKKLGVLSGPWASRQLMGTQKRVAALATEEIERRLLADPGDINIAALNFIAGTATDKLAKYERWERDEVAPPSYASALEKLASALAEGRVDLRIEVTRRDPAPALPEPLTIDIPPGS